MKVAGRTVWITGASSGIGAALAEELARRCARLILSARRGEQLDLLRLSLPFPERHRVVALDVTDMQSVRGAVEDVSTHEGSVDVLVNNAGISQRSLALETSLDVDRRIMDVNYFGSVALTKEILPSMISHGRGQIVVVSSLVGKIGTPFRSAYSASKHALQGFFDSLRAEVSGHGIGVTLILPGFVQTEISRNALRGDGSQHGVMDRHQEEGMDAGECARRIADAIESDRKEVSIAGREIVMVWARRWIPALYFWAIRRLRMT